MRFTMTLCFYHKSKFGEEESILDDTEELMKKKKNLYVLFSADQDKNSDLKD